VLGTGALFHDIGKLELPERITRKHSPLNKVEMGLFRQHCAHGVEIGRRMELSAEALNVIAQHHEHVDGSGYPKALKGGQISMLARIVAIADTFDTLCNPNNPSWALTPHEAMSTLYAQRRGQFETMPLNTFVRCMGIYPPGTIVVLSNEAIGMVVSVNSSRLLKPTVLVYDADVPRDEAVLVELENEPDVTIARTMKPHQLTGAMFDYLAPRKRTTYYFDSQPGALPR
jgi:putative nucleotidyltransferase with HDIG domain